MIGEGTKGSGLETLLGVISCRLDTTEGKIIELPPKLRMREKKSRGIKREASERLHTGDREQSLSDKSDNGKSLVHHESLRRGKDLGEGACSLDTSENLGSLSFRDRSHNARDEV